MIISWSERERERLYIYIQLYIYIPWNSKTYKNVGYEKNTMFFHKTRCFQICSFDGEERNEYSHPIPAYSSIPCHNPQQTCGWETLGGSSIPSWPVDSIDSQHHPPMIPMRCLFSYDHMNLLKYCSKNGKGGTLLNPNKKYGFARVKYGFGTGLARVQHAFQNICVLEKHDVFMPKVRVSTGKVRV